MNVKYSDKFEKIEKAKSKWMNELGKLSDEKQKSETVGQWSLIQHGYHLYLAEKGSLAYVKKKLSFNPTLDKSGIQTVFRIILLWFFMTSPFKFKAPATVSEVNFPDNLTFEMLERCWEESRTDLKSFLNSIGDKYIGLEVYKQPLAGRLTLVGMLRFFELHQNRHFAHSKKHLNR
tara:strand:+ start:404 stop:931 length:528 start_codon:yes stop_codon:yes gene_type:complete